MNLTLEFTKESLKDALKLKQTGLWKKAGQLLIILENNPFQTPPPFEKLIGDLSGAYSRRINIQHRLVYSVYEKEQIVRILRMRTHYD